MLRKLILATGVALALLAPAYAADPQTFKDGGQREDQGRRLHLPGVCGQGRV
jgi:hypothetical protein